MVAKYGKQNTKERRQTKKVHPIFSKNFSHIVYLSLHQNILKTIHLRY